MQARTGTQLEKEREEKDTDSGILNSNFRVFPLIFAISNTELGQQHI